MEFPRKQFCSEVDTEYQKLQGFSKTRRLALTYDIENPLKLYKFHKKHYF